MDKSGQLTKVHSFLLASYESWKCCTAVYDEITLKVIQLVLSKILHFLVLTKPYKSEQYVNCKAHIDKEFKRSEIVRKLVKNKYERSCEQGING